MSYTTPRCHFLLCRNRNRSPSGLGPNLTWPAYLPAHLTSHPRVTNASTNQPVNHLTSHPRVNPFRAEGGGNLCVTRVDKRGERPPHWRAQALLMLMPGLVRARVYACGRPRWSSPPSRPSAKRCASAHPRTAHALAALRRQTLSALCVCICGDEQGPVSRTKKKDGRACAAVTSGVACVPPCNALGLRMLRRLFRLFS